MCRKQTFSPSMEQHLSASPSPMVMELLGNLATGNLVLSRQLREQPMPGRHCPGLLHGPLPA